MNNHEAADARVQADGVRRLDFVDVNDVTALRDGELDRETNLRTQTLDMRMHDGPEIELIQGRLGQTGEAKPDSIGSICIPAHEAGLGQSLRNSKRRGTMHPEHLSQLL